MVIQLYDLLVRPVSFFRRSFSMPSYWLGMLCLVLVSVSDAVRMPGEGSLFLLSSFCVMGYVLVLLVYSVLLDMGAQWCGAHGQSRVLWAWLSVSVWPFILKLPVYGVSVVWNVPELYRVVAWGLLVLVLVWQLDMLTCIYNFSYVQSMMICVGVVVLSLVVVMMFIVLSFWVALL